IDGTRAFISGLPVWGTLIGLYWRGIPLAGVLDQPFTGERFMAYTDANGTGVSELSVRGDTVARNKTRATIDLADAILMTTSPRIFSPEDGARYDALERKVKLPRYGCDCYAYGMLAAGQIDLVVESGLHIYDIAAIIPIVRNAGGVVTSWQGEDPSKGGSVLAAANESLHEKALAILNG
ncbi:MAG: inositol monophosphatase family protein, partial [Pseudomonadota bacterium]